MTSLSSVVIIWALVTQEVYSKIQETCTVKLETQIDDGLCTNQTILSFSSKECANNSVCSKVRKMIYITSKPYSHLIVNDLLSTCCGKCAQKYLNIENVTNLSEITPELVENVDFIFPVFGRTEAPNLYGRWFLPIFETPSLCLLTLQREALLGKLIMSCVKMYPLLIIGALMVMISGFFCWLMERKRNESQFPRGFMLGWFEGIWWSFISMTTVGYGDKAPKSFPARLFSVIWIIVGVITFSLVTAMLTSEITQFNAQPPLQMEDRKIGVMRDHEHEMIIVAHHGGIIVPVEKDNFSHGILKLMNMLYAQEIDGFVMDFYEMMLYYHMYENHPEYRNVNQMLKKTSLNEIPHEERFSYGLLMKEEKDYKFFKGFIISNRDTMNSCNHLILRKYGRDLRSLHTKHSTLFETDGDIFWPTFVSCTIVVAIISICDAAYDLRRRIWTGQWKCQDEFKDDFSC